MVWRIAPFKHHARKCLSSHQVWAAPRESRRYGGALYQIIAEAEHAEDVISIVAWPPLRALTPRPLHAMRQMRRVAVELAEVDLVERFHASVKVHPPQRGRIERRAVGGQHRSRELVTEPPP